MTPEESSIILNTSSKAAEYKTGLSGWVSRDGRFCGEDERAARWSGCTHVVCECGRITKKQYIKCEACRRAASDARFASLEQKAWDRSVPLAIFESDTYFWNEDDLLDYCDEHGCKPQDLKLVICEPIYASQIDPYEYYCDDLPDDDPLLPGGLEEAFLELNRLIMQEKPILSWMPGKFRTTTGG